MFSKTTVALLALAAAFVSANPTTTNKKLKAARTQPEISKRTTHVGEGTVYLQEGGTGSCGETLPDSAVIAALSNYWMQDESPGPYCGRLVQVTNTGSDDGVGGAGNTVIVTVEDTCPSCDENHIDFSVGAWDALTNSAEYGTIEIEWHFCNVDGEC